MQERYERAVCLVGGIDMGTYFKIIDKNRTDGRIDIINNGRDKGILYDEIEEIVGDKECPCNGIPYPIEVDGWGELACIGEIYETEDFVVVCISEEEYNDYL